MHTMVAEQNAALEQERQKLKDLLSIVYPEYDSVIQAVGKSKKIDKQIRNSCPAIQCKTKRSFNYIIRHCVWQRLFSKDVERIKKANEYLTNYSHEYLTNYSHK